MYNDKQYHTRRLKPLKPVLNPNTYQFILWTTNQRWWCVVASHWYYKLWKR